MYHLNEYKTHQKKILDLFVASILMHFDSDLVTQKDNEIIDHLNGQLKIGI